MTESPPAPSSLVTPPRGNVELPRAAIDRETARDSRPSFVDRVSATLGWTRSRTSLPPGGPGFFRRNTRVLLVAMAVLVALSVHPVRSHARAAAFLLRLSGDAPSPATWVADDVVSERVDLPSELAGDLPIGDVKARIYKPIVGPLSGAPQGIVLAHGVHYLGIDEPRLVSLARSLCQAGFVVLTPELAPLADYHVDDPANLETLRVAVHYLARRTDLVRSGGVGLMGVSFAGGLSLRVASEDSVRGELAFVVSIGGHHHMRRIARFFATDTAETPDEGTIPWRAHDYGMAVLVYDAPEKFVDPQDAPQLRVALRAFLHESYALAEMESLKLSPPARAVFERLSHRDTHALAPLLLAAMPSIEQPMIDTSPSGTVSKITVPIFLLHGAHDNVVPPSESRWTASEAGSGDRVHLLVTSKIGHAELGDEGGAAETFRLVHFMAAMLDG